MSGIIIDFKKIEKWDLRFLHLASEIASWSKDPSTQVGAVIVRRDKTIASVGYNGFPRGCEDRPEYYADRDIKYPRVVHAEVNAILSAKEPLNGYTLYVDFKSPGLSPACANCAGIIIQSGINRVVGWQDSRETERWTKDLEIAAQMFREARIVVDFYPIPEKDEITD